MADPHRHRPRIAGLLRAAGWLGLGLGLGFWAGSWKEPEAPRGTPPSTSVVMPFDDWTREEAPTNNVVLPDLHDVEREEQRLASVALAEQNNALGHANDALRRQVGELNEQVAELLRDVAEERVRVDELRLERDRAEAGSERTAAGALSVSRLSLVDVSGEDGLVALGGGTAEGVKVGMLFHVVRDDRRIGGARVVQVRENLAAAVVEDVEGGPLRESDYVIPVRPESR